MIESVTGIAIGMYNQPDIAYGIGITIDIHMLTELAVAVMHWDITLLCSFTLQFNVYCYLY